MFEFVQRFFGKPASSTTARERLRLVLLSDHLSLAPDVVEALKRDLLEVISRYVEVDSANCDVTFEQQDKAVAMLANIPILGMRQSRPAPPAAPPPAAAVAHEPEAERQHELDLGPHAQSEPSDSANGGPSRSQRRRRRKRAAAAASGSTAPQPT